MTLLVVFGYPSCTVSLLIGGHKRTKDGVTTGSTTVKVFTPTPSLSYELLYYRLLKDLNYFLDLYS